MEKKITAASWSDLPRDLLSLIVKRFETRIETLHCRAVCHSWRSSISLPKKSPPLPLRLQFHVKDTVNRLGSYLLSQITIYRLEPDLETLKRCPNKGWLIKVQEPKDGDKIHALDIFSTLRIEYFPDPFPRVLNLLNFHVSEISRAFKLQKTKNADDDVEVEDDDARVYKVELSSNFESSKGVLAIKGGDLCSMKVGPEPAWVYLDNTVAYRDIVNYQGNFYAVDRFGVAMVIDESSLEVINFVLPPISFNGDWYFIKSCGDLFLVGRDLNLCADRVYYDKDMDAFVNEDNDFDIPVVFKVYTLSDGDDSYYRWREVNNLGDRAFFVSYHCSFSVLARDFAGYKANCIYFVDEIEYVLDDDEYTLTDDDDGYILIDDGGDGVDADDEPKGLNDDYDGGDDDGVPKGLNDDYDGGDDDELTWLDHKKVCVFNLEDGSSGPLTSYPGCSNLFWPPPAWLR